ncbi:MAG: N-acetylmuramoyl-L-alanine amidase [Sulfolobales archaeon]
MKIISEKINCSTALLLTILISVMILSSILIFFIPEITYPKVTNIQEINEKSIFKTPQSNFLNYLAQRKFIVWVWIRDTGSLDFKKLYNEYSDVIDIASPQWYFIDLRQGIRVPEVNVEDLIFINYSLSKNIILIPSISLADQQLVNILISNNIEFSLFTKVFIKKAYMYRYAGYNIDLKNIKFDNNTINLINKLAEVMHANNLSLVITVYITIPDSNCEATVPDLNKLGADIVIMSYEYCKKDMPHPLAPVRDIDNLLKYISTKTDMSKIILDIPNYGILWDLTRNKTFKVSYRDLNKIISEKGFFYIDNYAKELFYRSNDKLLYYIDGELAYYRIRLALAHNLKGVAMREFENSDPILWGLLRDLRSLFTDNYPTDYPLAIWSPAHNNNYKEDNRSVIKWIVIHVAEGNLNSVVAWFKNPSAKVSAHYVVGLDGSIYQMVRDKDIAWHAGNRLYNELSIGIEHEGWVSMNLFTDAQYMSSARLVAYLALKYGISLYRPNGVAPPDPNISSGIIGHDQVPDPRNPGLGGGANHHTDPGKFWNWTLHIDLVKKYYEALKNRVYEKSFVAVWWGFYSDKWSSNRDEWIKQVDETMRILNKAGIKAVFVLMKDPWGYVYYRSKYAPMNPKYSWDLLRDIIDLAKKHGLEVYVYINMLSEGETKPNFYIMQNPDMALRSLNGELLGWVDPACDEYRQRIMGIIEELIRNYPEIRGIQFDRIRASSADVRGRCSEEKFIKIYNISPDKDFDKYRNFLIEQISDLVKETSKFIKSLRKDLEVSAAVFPSTQAYRSVLQNWVEWINNNYLDYVVTMTYTDKFDYFKQLVEQQFEAIKDKERLYVGVGAYRLSNTQFIQQISYLLELRGGSGVFLFSVDGLLDRDLLKYLMAYRLSFLT